MSQSRRTFLKTGVALAAASLAAPRHSFASDPAAAAPLAQFGYGDVELLEGPLRQQFQTNHAFYARARRRLAAEAFSPARRTCPHPAKTWAAGTVGRRSATSTSPATTALLPATALGNIFPAWRATMPPPAKADAGQSASAGPQLCARPSRRTSGTGIAFPPTPTTRSPSACSMRTSSPATQMRSKCSTRPSIPSPASACPRSLARRAICPPARRRVLLLGRALHACRKTSSSPTSAARATAIAISPSASWPTTGTLNPLAAGQNVLPGKHAYSHVNAMSSAMQAYLVLGSEKHLRAAQERLRLSALHAELCHRRMGSGRRLPRAGQRRNRRKPHQDSLQL